MNLRKALAVALVALLCAAALDAYQRAFREYPGTEYEDFSLPPDYQAGADFVFARLMYPEGRGRAGFGFRRSANWEEGRTQWTNDYPRADRHLLVAIRRLTRVAARSVEQPVNLNDGDDVFNWPFLYAARAGFMQLSDAQTAKLREFIDRGGFFIADDMWGDSEYQGIVESMARLYPGRDIRELENKDPAFHTVYDLDQRYQISGQWSLRSGVPYLNGGVVPHWKGVYDDKDRMVAAVWVNNDTGDSWEWADDPSYPERYSALGIRLTVNHLIYAMTH
jgi:hypothetical protein